MPPFGFGRKEEPQSFTTDITSILAAPTGCGDVVNMKGFDQLGI